MNAVPAARYLADFSAEPGGAAKHQHSGHTPASDVTARIDEAFARGVEAGRAEAQSQFEATLQERQSEYEARLASERQEWAEAIGTELANRLLAAVKEIEVTLAETTARILKPFLAEGLRRQAVAELQASLERLLTTDSRVNLSISGPEDVLETLRAQLSGKLAAVTYTPGADCDVRIVADQATLETRLKDWLAKLDEAVP